MKDREMKPFAINRNSWHYKLNSNLFNEYSHSMEFNWEPRHNNFCSYWRATTFRVLFAAFLISGIMLLLTGLGIAIYVNPVAVMTAIGLVIGIITIAILFAYLHNRIEERKYSNKMLSKEPSQSLFAQKYRANKEKICPMVEYK
jgi:amino acid transporter